MLSVISAEALKLTRHRATWGLVWIYPIVLLVIAAIVLTIALSGNAEPEPAEPLNKWLESAAGFWHAPRNATVRILIAGFIAVAIAGEYGWNTWKLIVPHRSRWMLIAAKYVVTTLLLLFSFILTAWIFTATGWLEDRISGDPIPAGITAGGLIAAHWAGMLTAIGPLLLTIGYASLAAVITRSMIGALVVSIVAIVLEQAVANFAPLLSQSLPGLFLFLHNVLPGYHLANITSWVMEGAAATVTFPSGTIVAAALGTSVAIVAAWIIVPVALTFWRFGRQDIN